MLALWHLLDASSENRWFHAARCQFPCSSVDIVSFDLLVVDVLSLCSSIPSHGAPTTILGLLTFVLHAMLLVFAVLALDSDKYRHSYSFLPRAGLHLAKQSFQFFKGFIVGKYGGEQAAPRSHTDCP